MRYLYIITLAKPYRGRSYLVFYDFSCFLSGFRFMEGNVTGYTRIAISQVSHFYCGGGFTLCKFAVEDSEDPLTCVPIYDVTCAYCKDVYQERGLGN